MSDFLDAVFSAPAEKPKEAAPAAAPPPSEAAASPAPAPAARPGALEAKLQMLEAELLKEKERAMASEIRLKETQAAQSTVEQTLQNLYEKTAKERTDQELRVIREKASARVDALEGRLDEFQRGILELLKQSNDNRRQEHKEVQEAGHEGLERRLASFERHVTDLLEGFWDKKEQVYQEALNRALNALRSEVVDNERVQAQNASMLREEVRMMRTQIQQAAEMSQTMMQQKFQQLEEKLLAAGKVTAAARLVIHAVDRMDPLLVEKPVLEELQQLREALANTFLKSNP